MTNADDTTRFLVFKYHMCNTMMQSEFHEGGGGIRRICVVEGAHVSTYFGEGGN